VSEQQQEASVLVESGEYYREAMRWYSTKYHSPIAERALLIIITVGAAVVTLMTIISLFMVLPLVDTKTMIVRVPQSLDRVARVQQLMTDPRGNPNHAVMEWFVSNFVEVRESYDIDKQERYNVRVWALSSQPVYAQYSAYYKGAESPTRRFERHTKRSVSVRDITVKEVESLGRIDGSPAETVDVKATVQFEATELSSREERKSAWVADIAFRFSKIHVDQITGEMTPMEFKVTGYESKQLGLE